MELYLTNDIKTLEKMHFSKDDLIKISESMSSVVTEQFHTDTPPDIIFEYSQDGCDFKYNYDEFKKHFSKTTPFSTLSILVIAVGSMSYISFSMRNGSSEKGTIAVNSRIHTKAELEDMLANLIGQIESLRFSTIQCFSVYSTPMDLPQKNQVDKHHTQEPEYQTNVEPPRAPTDKAPFYTLPVFWTALGAVANVIKPFRDIILDIIQRFS